MSIKRFCDVCGEEMNESRMPGTSETLNRMRVRIRRVNPAVDYGVEVIHSTDGTANHGDVCKYCILDALYELDGRPRPK